MNIIISYHTIESDHVLATPEFTHSEVIEALGFDDPKLIKYIESKTDGYGHKFKKKKNFGFDYISRAGGVKVEEYKELEKPKIKKL
jgi:hypothetical protein